MSLLEILTIKYYSCRDKIMERDIITIDEKLCNGCGQCVPGCPEGALQIIDGKARLISDLFCDGLGACIGECPEGAIFIEKREAEPYNEVIVMGNIVKHGESTIRAHLLHLRDHNETVYLNTAIKFLKDNGLKVPDDLTGESRPPEKHPHKHGECQGSAEKEIHHSGTSSGPVSAQSHLSQWPIQLQLVNSKAPYFNGADLLIAADCVPFSIADFHEKFLKDKKLIIFCPKLDSTIDNYIEKLKDIFTNQNIKSITIAHMEVPCCFGISKIVETSLQKAGVTIPVKDLTISIDGKVK